MLGLVWKLARLAPQTHAANGRHDSRKLAHSPPFQFKHETPLLTLNSVPKTPDPIDTLAAKFNADDAVCGLSHRPFTNQRPSPDSAIAPPERSCCG
jgi:hypothetical protein